MEEFLTAALKGQGPGPAPVEAAVRVLKILDATYLAADTGQTVRVTQVLA